MEQAKHATLLAEYLKQAKGGGGVWQVQVNSHMHPCSLEPESHVLQ